MDARTVVVAPQRHPKLHRWSAAPWSLLWRLQMERIPWLLQQARHPMVLCGPSKQRWVHRTPVDDVVPERGRTIIGVRTLSYVVRRTHHMGSSWL